MRLIDVLHVKISRRYSFNGAALSFLLIVIISFTFCNSSAGKKDFSRHNEIIKTPSDSSLRYDLDNPDEKYLLPDYLREISGIVYFNGDRILCVQDSKANIYEFAPDRNEVINKNNFGTDGDYEDISVIDKTAFVVRSDGTIFGVKDFGKSDRIITEYKTQLTGKNNIEGLAYDKSSNSLLLACKGSPDISKEKQFRGYKAIYKFDLQKLKLDKEPVYLIDLFKKECYKNETLLNKFSSGISKKQQLLKSGASFKPSGLAINPLTDEIYLISGTFKILIILDRNGKILDYKDLDNNIFRQPEGICFSPSGDLFISSEGAGGKGYILKFKLLNTGR